MHSDLNRDITICSWSLERRRVELEVVACFDVIIICWYDCQRMLIERLVRADLGEQAVIHGWFIRLSAKGGDCEEYQEQKRRKAAVGNQLALERFDVLPGLGPGGETLSRLGTLLSGRELGKGV